MTQIVVTKDEWYGWFATDVKPEEARSIGIGGEIVLDVDPADARRWKKATKDFARAMVEIELMVEIRGETKT
jgi:hypothetical protein